jgi:K+-transporting ATPase ATPase A chain
LAFNTGASFVTNINWQSYSGETSLSNFSQMAVIIFPQVASAATGLAAADGFMHGLQPEDCRRFYMRSAVSARCT